LNALKWQKEHEKDMNKAKFLVLSLKSGFGNPGIFLGRNPYG